MVTTPLADRKEQQQITVQTLHGATTHIREIRYKRHQLQIARHDNGSQTIKLSMGIDNYVQLTPQVLRSLETAWTAHYQNNPQHTPPLFTWDSGAFAVDNENAICRLTVKHRPSYLMLHVTGQGPKPVELHVPHVMVPQMIHDTARAAHRQPWLKDTLTEIEDEERTGRRPGKRLNTGATQPPSQATPLAEHLFRRR